MADGAVEPAQSGFVGDVSPGKPSPFECECCAAQHYEHKWWNRELTLKCKLKCYVKPMKDPLGVSPSKGNQGTTRGKEKIFF